MGGNVGGTGGWGKMVVRHPLSPIVMSCGSTVIEDISCERELFTIIHWLLCRAKRAEERAKRPKTAQFIRPNVPSWLQ